MTGKDFTIVPHNDGPYEVRGTVSIVTEGGRVIQAGETEAWLCRCGQSANKPFCDGTHTKIGFQSNLDAAPDPAEEGFEDACADTDVAEGDIKGVRVEGQPIVVGRVGGTIYAIGGVCSHQKALLEDGELDDKMVRCPLHGSGFDIVTGKPTCPPATVAVPTFDVKVENGRLLVSRKPR